MAEAQFTPANSNPVNAASTAATTMMSLFERAQKLRTAKERSQQVQELHELTIQSREQGLATGALNFEYEQLKLQAKQIEAQKQVEMEASNDRSYVNSVQGFFNLRSDINAEYARTENPNEQPSSKSVQNFQNRLDRRRADANELMKSDPRRGRQILEELNSIEGLLDPMANQVKEANVTRFGEMSTDLVTLSSGTKTEPGSVRRDLAKILTKYADLRHINPEVFKGLKDDALAHIKTLESTAAKAEASEEEYQNKLNLAKLANLSKKDAAELADKEAKIELAEKVEEKERSLVRTNLAIEDIKKALDDIETEEVRPGGWVFRAGKWIRERVSGEKLSEKRLAKLITTEWVALVSKLKGALSEKEGERFDLALPNFNSKPEVWVDFLTQQLRYLEPGVAEATSFIKRFKVKEATVEGVANAEYPPPRTDEGTAVLEGVNLDDLSRGGQD